MFSYGRGRYYRSSEREQNLRIKTQAKKKQKQAIEALLIYIVGFDKFDSQLFVQYVAFFNKNTLKKEVIKLE